MRSGEYIVDRMMPDMVRQICAEQGIAMSSYSDDWVMVLQKDALKCRIYGFRFGLNDSAAAGIAQDKVATYLLLESAGIPAIAHRMVSTRATHSDAWHEEARKWGRFLIKPLYGMGGRSIYMFDDIDQASQMMLQHPEQSWAVSPFVTIRKEIRLILLGDETILAFEKRQPVSQQGVPMFNLRLGAQACVITPDEQMDQLAQKTRRVLGLELVAVDIVELTDGRQYVLEVNEGFSLEHLARQSDEYRRAAYIVYRKIIDKKMRQN